MHELEDEPRVDDDQYRVETLAARAGLSVDTVRYYQAKGLLPPPRRQGRVAWYTSEHLRRLHRVRSLQARGFSLATIARVLDGSLDAADEALVHALMERSEGRRHAGHPPAARRSATGSATSPLLSLTELAERTGIPAPVLDAVAAEGLLVPQRIGDRSGYTEEDVEAARAGLTLLGWGVPLSDLLALAAAHHRAVQDVAQRAVELFDTHVRQRLRDEPAGELEAATQLVDAFDALLPAATSLVAHHFTRVLLDCARSHVDRAGTPAQRNAVLLATGSPASGDSAGKSSETGR